MDLQTDELLKRRDGLKTTVLYRPGGRWDHIEIARFTGGLKTEVSVHPGHPEYLILFGHWTREQTLKALVGGLVYTTT